MNERCLYNNDFQSFLLEDPESIFGKIDLGFHGSVLTTSRDAWIAEIAIMKDSISK